MSPRARRPPGVRVEARAKLNLGLAVGPKRPDGYHELITVFQSISLADTLLIRPRERGFRLTIRYEDVALPGTRERARPPDRSRSLGHTPLRAGETRRRPVRAPRTKIPTGSDNLVLRAAQLLARTHALSSGADITLIKRIPVQAGLGGGSADAAAAIVGIARLNGLRLPAAERMRMALALGSDVPFALRGGTALGRGRGEQLTRLRLAKSFRVLIAMPDWGIATALAYRNIDKAKYGLTGWGAKLRFAQRLASERLSPRRALALGNTFEQVLGERSRAFQALAERLRACGVREPRMTGSGSAVFGILPDNLPLQRAIRRFEGHERLFAARSVGSARRLAAIG